MDITPQQAILASKLKKGTAYSVKTPACLYMDRVHKGTVKYLGEQYALFTEASGENGIAFSTKSVKIYAQATVTKSSGVMTSDGTDTTWASTPTSTPITGPTYDYLMSLLTESV